MSLPALAGYFATLRTTMRPRPSQQDVADRIGVRVNSLIAWETGKSMPAADNAAKYLAVVGGSSDQLHVLLLNPVASYEDGERAAHIWRVVSSSDASLDDPDTLAAILRRLSPPAAAELIQLLKVL